MPETRQDSPSHDHRPAWAAGAGCVLLVGLACLGKFDNQFVWDDVQLVLESDWIHDPRNLPATFLHNTHHAADGGTFQSIAAVDTYRPVTLATFFWDAAWSGREPFSYHLTNLLAHLAAVALVYGLALRLLGPARAAAPFAALLFGLHPALAEAHVWIDGRSDLFAAVFGLSALLLHLRGGAARWLAPPLFLLGCLSKEVLLLTLPAITLLDVLRAEGGQAPRGVAPSAGRAIYRALPLWAAGAVYLAVRVVVLSGLKASGGGDALALALSRLGVLWMDAVAQALVPARLHVRSLEEEYAALPAWVLAAGWAASIGLAAWAWRGRRARPLAAFAVLWSGATLAPVCVITTLRWWGFDRYLYLPMAAVSLAVVEVTGQALGRLDAVARARAHRAAAAGAAVLLAGYGATLHRLSADWHDLESLPRSIADRAPHLALGWLGLGEAAARQGRREDAVRYYTEAVRVAPGDFGALYDLGLARLDLGDPTGALQVADRGERAFPHRPDFPHLRALATVSTRPDTAVLAALAALRIDPRHPPARALVRALLDSHPDRAEYVRRLRDARDAEAPGPIRDLLDEALASADPVTGRTR